MSEHRLIEIQSNAQRTVSLTASLEKRVHDDLAELERASDEALQTALSTASSTPSKNDTSVNPRSELEAKIAEMKEKLDGSVKLGTKAAEEARSEVLRCLVEKDRRPLECAEAVRKFREEARRVEKEWVEKVL